MLGLTQRVALKVMQERLQAERLSPGIEYCFKHLKIRYIAGHQSQVMEFCRRCEKCIHRSYRTSCGMAARHRFTPGLCDVGVDG